MFWFIVALLSLLAVAIVLFPLLRRSDAEGPAHQALNAAVLASQQRELEQDLAEGNIDAEQFRHAEAELKREARAAATAPVVAPRTNRSLAAAVVAGVAIPAIAFAVYNRVGTQIPAEEMAPMMAQPASGGMMAPMPGDFSELIARLETRLKSNPDDPEGWALLARSFDYMGEREKALQTFRGALDHGIRNAMLYAQYAELLAVDQGSYKGEPTRLIQKALDTKPDDEQALRVAISAAFERGDLKRAIKHMERLQPLLDPASEDAMMVKERLRTARAELAGK